MARSYYSNSIHQFAQDSPSSVLGKLSSSHGFDLAHQQMRAWKGQIAILQKELRGEEDGHIFFEFSIPRMGKRVDNIIVYKNALFVIEFKVGSDRFQSHAIEQAYDYALDLKNFHEGSHFPKIIPVLISTNAKKGSFNFVELSDRVFQPIAISPDQIKFLLSAFPYDDDPEIRPVAWAKSNYKPTPTIIEAAQALYKGHSVKEISRSDSGAINLSTTTSSINRIIDQTKEKQEKTICFVTGVPGAGKTLAGLNIAIERQRIDEDENAVFLSGNGPLVDVLREALARDQVKQSTLGANSKITKKEASRKTKGFIQNIHHFRDDAIKTETAPDERVVIFDEAQRAWTAQKASDFMRRRKGVENFNMSEPEFLISVLERHQDWAVIICLIGGGQEINVGEAGLEEWFAALKDSFPNWAIYYSDLIITDSNYLKRSSIIDWIQQKGKVEKDLHLAVSVRSFRSEHLSKFVKNVLDLNFEIAHSLYLNHVKEYYPIAITRDLETGKKWLRDNARGSERFGIIASSKANRLRPLGINIKDKIDAPNWFLNGKDDVRSSYYLEEIATEFDIQGLELDWTMVCWDADLSISPGLDAWNYRKFSGTKWQEIKTPLRREYLKNAYRVLLTRARQGIIIFVPKGNSEDPTRPSEFYDQTFNYWKSLGIEEIPPTPSPPSASG